MVRGDRERFISHSLPSECVLPAFTACLPSRLIYADVPNPGTLIFYLHQPYLGLLPTSMGLCLPLRHPDFLTHASGCLPRQPLQMPSVFSPSLLGRGRAQGESNQAQGHPQANREWLVTTGCILHTRAPSLGPTPSPDSMLSGSLSAASHPESPLCSGNQSGLLKFVLASHLGLALLHKACLPGLAVPVQIRRPLKTMSF